MNLQLGEKDTKRISDFIRKYEKYKNLYNSGSFDDSLDEIAEDIAQNINVDCSVDKIKEFVRESFELSEGLSIVMSPNAQFQYTNIDQVQRFHY
jgi:hypothetical protein